MLCRYGFAWFGTLLANPPTPACTECKRDGCGYRYIEQLRYGSKFTIPVKVSSGRLISGACSYIRGVRESLVPAKIATQELVEASIVRLEKLDQPFSQRGIHPGVRGVVILFIDLPCQLRFLLGQGEEGQYLFDAGGRRGVEILAPEDQELLSREQTHPGLQLLDIDAAAQVAAMPIYVALVVLVSQDFFSFRSRAFHFIFDGLFKGQRFKAMFNSMIVLGVGAVYGVAQQDDEPGLGQRLCYPSGDMRVKQVGGAGFPCHKSSPTEALCVIFFDPAGKMSTIPGQSSVKSSIKKMDFFGTARLDAGVRL